MARSSYPPIDRLRKRGLQPGPLRQADERPRPTRPRASTSTSKRPQFLGFAASPSQIQSAIVTLPEGLTINPDAADGQSACTDAQANFGTEAPADCPDNAKIGTFAIGTAGPRRTRSRARSTSANRSRATSTALFLVADGFGIHAKLVGSVQPDPGPGR